MFDIRWQGTASCDLLLFGLDLSNILVLFAAKFILHGYSEDYFMEVYF